MNTAPTGLIVAHHLRAAANGLVVAHPAVAEARAIDLTQRWDLPTDVDVIFALHSATDPTAHHVPRPIGWPGRVKFVQLASSGSDGYPEWLGDGPVVASSAGTSAPAIAEFVLAAMLMVEKRLPAMVVTDGAWTPQAAVIARPLGTLDGRTLGLLGVGEIGSRVAALATAFGMTVIAHRRRHAAIDGVELVSFDDLLRRSDHLVVAAPLTAATSGMLGADAFARVKSGVHLVNIARGGLIDTAALIAALETGHVGFASLDVTDPEPLPPGHPLWAAPNVRITPHIAWSSPRTSQRIFALFAENLGRFARGERLINQQ
jgi:phosphoglycerate dehydrogenase-like enzyme